MKLCKAKTKQGKQCKCWALHGEDLCLFHSKSDIAKKYRRTGWDRSAQKQAKVWPNEILIGSLQRELKKLDEIKDPVVRINTRMKLIELIAKLKGEKIPVQETEEESPLDERLRKFNQEKDKEESK